MILEHACRPVVVFNPANKEHRQHYADFIKNSSRGKCPVRFAIDTDEASNNNLAYAMQRLLTEYYMGAEFNATPKAHPKSVLNVGI